MICISMKMIANCGGVHGGPWVSPASCSEEQEAREATRPFHSCWPGALTSPLQVRSLGRPLHISSGYRIAFAPQERLSVGTARCGCCCDPSSMSEWCWDCVFCSWVLSQKVSDLSSPWSCASEGLVWPLQMSGFMSALQMSGSFVLAACSETLLHGPWERRETENSRLHRIPKAWPPSPIL